MNENNVFKSRILAIKSFEEEKGYGVHEVWSDIQTDKERFITLYIGMDVKKDSLYVHRKCDSRFILLLPFANLKVYYIYSIFILFISQKCF